MSDWNNKIIEEFRANKGKVGGPFEGAPLLLLHTVGARTGQERVNPMMYMPVDGGYAVFASKGGAPTNPDWYHNLLAHPKVTAEIGTGTVELIARVAEGDGAGADLGGAEGRLSRVRRLRAEDRPGRSRSSSWSPSANSSLAWPVAADATAQAIAPCLPAKLPGPGSL